MFHIITRHFVLICPQHYCHVCLCVLGQVSHVKSSAKDSRWYDVGIVKVTNMVVSHYYVPYDDDMADVRASISINWINSGSVWIRSLTVLLMVFPAGRLGCNA